MFNFSNSKGSLSEHLPNVPANVSTPIIAKISKNRQQTIVTFVMDGNEDKRDVTISFMPGFLLIILSGLNARKALSAFNDCKLEAIFA